MFSDYAPWDSYLFEKYDEDKHFFIPMSNSSIWLNYPSRKSYIFKTNICELQRIPYGISGIIPEKYPIFLKPIIKMYGFGENFKIVHDEKNLKVRPGYFWMPYFSGDVISTDCLISEGKVLWYQQTIGKKKKKNFFDYWKLIKNDSEKFEVVHRFLYFLQDYEGLISFKQISNVIISVKFFPNSQFINLYDKNFLKKVVRFYKTKQYSYIKVQNEKYSVPIYIPRNDFSKLKNIDKIEKLENVIITVDKSYKEYTPLGNKMIGYVNGENLKDLKNIRLEFLKKLKKL